MKFKKLNIALVCSSLIVSMSAQAQGVQKVLSTVIKGGIEKQVDGGVKELINIGCQFHKKYIDTIQTLANSAKLGDDYVASQNSFIHEFSKNMNGDINETNDNLLKGMLTKWVVKSKRDAVVDPETLVTFETHVAPYPFEIDYTDDAGSDGRKIKVGGADAKDIAGTFGHFASGMRCYSSKDTGAVEVDSASLELLPNKGGANLAPVPVRLMTFNPTQNRLCSPSIYADDTALAAAFGTGAAFEGAQGLNPFNSLCPGTDGVDTDDSDGIAGIDFDNGSKCTSPTPYNLVLIRTSYEVAMLLNGIRADAVDGTFWITESYFQPLHDNNGNSFTLKGTFNVFDIDTIVGAGGDFDANTNKTFSSSNLPTECIALSDTAAVDSP